MTASTATAPRIAIRPLAIPNEHGGWGFLFEPIVLALLAAPSAAGALVGVAAIGAFLARHPLKLAAADWLRHKRYPRTSACERIGAGYAAIALASLAIAIFLGNPQLLGPLLIAAPFGFVQFAYDARNRGRAALPELVGSIAMGAVAASIALASSKSLAFAGALWAITLCRSIPAIVYVRSLLGRGRGAYVTHVVAIVISVALWRLKLAPFVAIVAFAALLVRAIVGLHRERPAAKTIGITELIYGGLTIIATGIGYAV